MSTGKGERKILCLDKLSCTQKCCHSKCYRATDTVEVMVILPVLPYIPCFVNQQVRRLGGVDSIFVKQVIFRWRS